MDDSFARSTGDVGLRKKALCNQHVFEDFRANDCAAIGLRFLVIQALDPLCNTPKREEKKKQMISVPSDKRLCSSLIRCKHSMNKLSRTSTAAYGVRLSVRDGADCLSLPQFHYDNKVTRIHFIYEGIQLDIWTPALNHRRRRSRHNETFFVSSFYVSCFYCVLIT